MSGRKFDFWRDHSLNYLQMAFGFDRHSRLQNPDGFGRQTGECGDTVEMSHLAEGKTMDEGWEITPETVTEFLETLPEGNYHCAELAVDAFYAALANYQALERNSWKKPYQKAPNNNSGNQRRQP